MKALNTLLFFFMIAFVVVGASCNSKPIPTVSFEETKDDPFVSSSDTANHQAPDEVLLTNISTECYTLDDSGSASTEWTVDPNFALIFNFGKINFKSKRLGNTAYSLSGAVVPGMKPVFVEKSELDSNFVRQKQLDKRHYEGRGEPLQSPQLVNIPLEDDPG